VCAVRASHFVAHDIEAREQRATRKAQRAEFAA